MTLRRYCVTVMDNWTPMREFWTLRGAIKYWSRYRNSGGHLFVWSAGHWREYHVTTTWAGDIAVPVHK